MDVNIDVSEIVIKTKRLILRAWRETDLADLYAYASVPGVGEMAGWKYHRSTEVSQMVLQSFIDDKDVFAIVHQRDSKVIGSLGLHYSWANEEDEYKSLKAKEIGYILSKDYWGQGITAEAVRAVIEYCSANFDIEAFTCRHFSDNIQSRRVIEKSGFTFVKESDFYSKQLQQTFADLKYIWMRKEQEQ